MSEFRLLLGRAATMIACSSAAAILTSACFGRSDLESFGLPDGGLFDGAAGFGASGSGGATGDGGAVTSSGGTTNGAGGATFAGGSFGDGGFIAAGGSVTGTGGFVSAGGETSSGGITSTGGVIGGGGVVGTGGVIGAGGVVGNGGVIGAGGVVGTGGVIGAGGVVGTGGLAGTGGFTPVCSATTCSSGCCDAQGQCEDGRTDLACGASGQVCTDCGASGEHCAAAGFCYTGAHCGPDNCGGCCTPNGLCRAGTGARNCGRYGAVCENCNAVLGETCQVGACALPGATCPGPYGGCLPGSATTPPVASKSCSATDLTKVANGCAATQTSAACTAALTALAQSNTACFGCLGQFLNDGAVAKCLAPFMSASCNESLTCATDCSNGVCGQCAASGKKSCQTGAFAGGGVCNAYVSGYFCAQAAFGGSGAFCDAERIGDTGAFLKGVGTYYCSK